MAFRKKANYLLSYKPDILVIPECEHPDKIIFENNLPLPTGIIWEGANLSKGLGIFAFNNLKLEILDCYNPSFKTVIPIKVSGCYNFTLFAIWANNPLDKLHPYIGQVWKALDYYKDLIASPVILIGDFNSNSIWDKPKRVGNHTHVVERLNQRGIYSSYHHFHNISQGQELHPTLFMYRHENKPYHIDYCFVCENFINKISSVEIGDFKKWSKLSDHSPLIVKFVD